MLEDTSRQVEELVFKRKMHKKQKEEESGEQAAKLKKQMVKMRG